AVGVAADAGETPGSVAEAVAACVGSRAAGAAADAGETPGSVAEAVSACLGRGAGMARGTLPAALVLELAEDLEALLKFRLRALAALSDARALLGGALGDSAGTSPAKPSKGTRAKRLTLAGRKLHIPSETSEGHASEAADVGGEEAVVFQLVASQAGVVRQRAQEHLSELAAARDAGPPRQRAQKHLSELAAARDAGPPRQAAGGPGGTGVKRGKLVQFMAEEEGGAEAQGSGQEEEEEESDEGPA
ncbi:hypothetical protein T484DRAFT_1793426, partial [Baffinella frigidus]